ncbi:MAG: flagellar protein FlaG [Firmicutes bacterium]|nr:flagellar protein FlaG [Bacillota bacterium]
MKIDGTDPLRLNKIQDQVSKPVVQRLGETDTENKIRDRQQVSDKSLPHDSRPYMEKLEQAIKQSNETADTLNLGIRFKLHESSERYMVQIVDRADNAVIKEIPPERVLNLVGQIQEVIGLLLDEKR